MLLNYSIRDTSGKKKEGCNMDKQFADTRDNSMGKADVSARRNIIIVPFIALGLDLLFIPIVFFAFLVPRTTPFLYGFIPFLYLLAVISPIAGLVLGITSLSLGKHRIDAAGKAAAIAAIALPASVIIFILVFYIGAVTGVISLM